MARDARVVYVSYEEAQRLLPVFRYLAKYGPWKEVRDGAKVFVRELGLVRPIDYALGGDQIFLSEHQYEFFLDVKASLEEK